MFISVCEELRCHLNGEAVSVVSFKSSFSWRVSWKRRRLDYPFIELLNVVKQYPTSQTENKSRDNDSLLVQ
jgi:hypothetical protein